MSESITSALSRTDFTANQAEQGDHIERTVAQLFMLFHGYWGTLFLSKFATGDLDDRGHDRGVKSARAVWTRELTRFDPSVIKAAADRVRVDNLQFPPSLPAFVAYCDACKPRKTHAEQLRLGESEESKGLRNAAARAAAMATLTLRRRAQAAHVDPVGMSALQLLVAQAAALAGGDEAKVLRRLAS